VTRRLRMANNAIAIPIPTSIVLDGSGTNWKPVVDVATPANSNDTVLLVNVAVVNPAVELRTT